MQLELRALDPQTPRDDAQRMLAGFAAAMTATQIPLAAGMYGT